MANAPSEDELKNLLNIYEQFQGQAPADAPPELKSFFESIDKTKQEQMRKQQTQAQEASQEIYPAPEFVVKTADDSGRKVFLNVCSSDAVQAPGNWEGGAVPEAVKANLANLENLSEADQEHMRFPLSLSEPRNDLDKQGDACTVFDCIFNTDIIRGAQKLRSLKVFIIEMALGWIQHKHNLTLDARFKLPKLRYKGDTIAPQNIRREKRPMVVEMNDADAPDDEPALPLRVAPIPKGKTFKPTIEELPASLPVKDVHRATPNHHPPAAKPNTSSRAAEPAAAAALSTSGSDVDVKYHELPCQRVTVTVRMPGGRKWKQDDIVVQASCMSVHINIVGVGPRVVQLNVYVKAETGRVELQDGCVCIHFQYFPVDQLLEYMRACKPFAVGTLQFAANSLLDELQ